ncbi:MAG: hypothetical protein NWQ51_08230, partial [OM182 bacterium]|nr:hypothetical protein [OM182 bacterium]
VEQRNWGIGYLQGNYNNLQSPKQTPALVMKPPLVKPYTMTVQRNSFLGVALYFAAQVRGR